MNKLTPPLSLQTTTGMDPSYSNDGIQLAGEAYTLWANTLPPYIDAEASEAENLDGVGFPD